MASLGDAKIGEDLMRSIMEATGRSYSTGSTYDVEFRGPGVSITEYDADGVKVDALRFTSESTRLADYSLEIEEINRIRSKNRAKEIFMRVYVTVIGLSTLLALMLSLYLREV